MGLLDTEVAKWKRAFGLLGGIPKTFKNNPRNAETMDAVFGFGGIIPGVGDAVSAAEAKYRYDQGDMLGAGLAGLGALPMVPALAGTFIGKGTKAANTGKAGQRFTDLLSPDYKLLDQAKRGGLLDVYPTPDRFVGAVRPGDTWAGFPARAYMEQRLVDKQVSTAAAPAQYAAGTGQSFRAQQDIPSYINDRPRNALGQEIPPTPYELAHAEAQRVAALPVEQGGLGLPANNTAMERARAMGFELEWPTSSKQNKATMPLKDFFHGTNSDVPAFDATKKGFVTDNISGPYEVDRHARFVAENPLFAEGFAAQKGLGGANVMPLRVRSGNLLDLTEGFDDDAVAALSKYGLTQQEMRQTRPEGMWQAFDGNEGKRVTESMKLSGYDTARIVEPDELSGGMEYTWAIPDPSRIRSRFAAFNPAKRDSADLLAGLAPWALPVGATLLGGSFLLPPEEY